LSFAILCGYAQFGATKADTWCRLKLQVENPMNIKSPNDKWQMENKKWKLKIRK
jgi:hypothetical protein